jgi:hypothetical protein
MPFAQGKEVIKGEHPFRRLSLKLKHKAKSRSQLGREVKAPPEVGVLNHQGHRPGILKDVTEFLHWCGSAAHRISGPGPHQPLIRHQPAGAVLRKEPHHIAGADAKRSERARRPRDSFVQLAVTEALRMNGMGSVNRQHPAVMVSKPRPDLIHPSEGLHMLLTGQGLLLPRCRAPTGLSE